MVVADISAAVVVELATSPTLINQPNPSPLSPPEPTAPSTRKTGKIRIPPRTDQIRTPGSGIAQPLTCQWEYRGTGTRIWWRAIRCIGREMVEEKLVDGVWGDMMGVVGGVGGAVVISCWEGGSWFLGQGMGR